MSDLYDQVSIPSQFHFPQWMTDSGNIARVQDVQLKRYHLLNSGISNLRIVKSAFSQFNMLDARVENVHWLYSEFKESDFNSVVFHNCYFKGMLFEKCSFRNIHFEKCIFDSCRFQSGKEFSEGDNIIASDCIFMTPDFVRDDLLKGRAVEFKSSLFFCDELPAHLVDANECLAVPSVTRPVEALKSEVPLAKVSKESIAAPPEKPKDNSAGSRFDRLEV